MQLRAPLSALAAYHTLLKVYGVMAKHSLKILYFLQYTNVPVLAVIYYSLLYNWPERTGGIGILSIILISTMLIIFFIFSTIKDPVENTVFGKLHPADALSNACVLASTGCMIVLGIQKNINPDLLTLLFTYCYYCVLVSHLLYKRLRRDILEKLENNKSNGACL